jgi:hypothetical protein
MKPLAVLLALLLAPVAWAEQVGVYAPSAPFDGPVARVDFANRVAAALAQATGVAWEGRSYARAADFSAAVKRGEVTVAVVDVAYLAASGAGYPVLAGAVHGGALSTSWELVGARGVAGLKGKTLVVPSVGARDESFVLEVLLEGEVDRSHFGKITYAPDALSAIASLEHGRADAALVPSGLKLPAGVRTVTTLRHLAWPVVVGLPGLPAALRAKIEKALPLATGDPVFERLVAVTADGVKTVAGRFGRPARRGPLVVPALKIAADALLSGRFTIARPDVTRHLLLP